MLELKKIKQLVSFWEDDAKEKLKTMQSLLKSKRHADALFFGHLVLEKTLKALVVKQTQKHPPYQHNLLVLAKYAKIELSQDEKELLAEVNVFNIQARYPDEKLDFYKKCNKHFASIYSQKITNFHKKYASR